MNKKNTLAMIFAIVSISQGLGQAGEEHKSWKFDISPYAWLAGKRGEVTFMDQSGTVDYGFDNVFRDQRVGVALHTEATNGEWVILADLNYITTVKDDPVDGTGSVAELAINQLTFELAGGPILVNFQDWLLLDAFAGLRYYNFDNRLEIEDQSPLDKTIHATDPIIGIRFRTVDEKWINSARIDIGGLGIGSDITWKFNFLVGHRLGKLSSFYLGAQAYYVDYEENDFEIFLLTAGIITGINLHF